MIPFTVALCVYHQDHPDYFKEALESVVHQRLMPAEVVLVVDGVIGEALEQVIVWFHQRCEALGVVFEPCYLESNRGHGEARRISIERASHPLVALMDADDLSDYERFAKQVARFEQSPQLSIVGGQIVEIDHATKRPLGRREVPLTDSEIRAYLQRRCPFNQVTVMVRREDILAVGNYIDFYHNEDYYLWVRMYLAGYHFANLPDVLVEVRINEAFYDRRGGWRYFLSEFRLQRIMYREGITSLGRFLLNSAMRLVLQVLLSDRLRGILFQKLAREGIQHG